MQNCSETEISQQNKDTNTPLNLPTWSTNFLRLNKKEVIQIPGSKKVHFQASTLIPAWNFIAIGYTTDKTYALALYDLKTNQLLSTIDDAHTEEIRHVEWVESENYLITSSVDRTIGVFTTMGHSGQLKCLKRLRVTYAPQFLKSLDDEGRGGQQPGTMYQVPGQVPSTY